MRSLKTLLLVLLATPVFGADFGDIPANLTLPAGQSVRRNAANTLFEAYTPSTGGAVSITATAPVVVTPSPLTGTGVISMGQAGTGTNGWLSSTDWNTFNGKQNTITPAALTKADDTNVTLTLGGSPAVSLLAATSITVGWSGQLAVSRGGTGAATFPAHNYFGNNTGSTAAPAPHVIDYTELTNTPTPAPTPPSDFGIVAVSGQSNVVADAINDTLTLVAGSNITITTNASTDTITFNATASGGTVTSITATAPIVVTPSPLVSTGVISITGSALTKTDDTNVTLTLGGTPTTALLQATSLTLGWSGQLAVSRGGTGAATFAAHSYFGNNTGSTAAPAPHVIDYSELSGTPTIPTDISGASFITKVAESGLSNEFALSSLANGILFNHTSTGIPTIAVARTDYWDTTDVVASGVSHAHGLVPDPGSSAGTTRFLREDATFAVPPGTGGVTFANPTALVGTAVINGAAGTAMRSDAAPALNLAINPTWTAIHTWSLDDATNSGTTTIQILRHTTSGTAAAGIGANTEVHIENSTGGTVIASRDDVVLTNATSGGATAYRDFAVVSSGTLASKARLYGSGGMWIGTGTPADPGAGILSPTAGYIVGGAAPASGKFLQSVAGTKYEDSSYKLPTTVGTTGKILISNGTDYVSSTPTYPNASATSRKILVSDGTNFIASTETWAVPGTAGNGLSSDGTNWVSGAPDGSKPNSTASTTTWTPDFDTYSMEVQTALAGALTINAPTWTGTRNGTRRIIRLKDNGTARAITWTTGSTGAFRASTDLALPTTTIANKTIYLRFYWNNDDSRWDFMAKLDNF